MTNTNSGAGNKSIIEQILRMYSRACERNMNINRTKSAIEGHDIKRVKLTIDHNETAVDQGIALAVVEAEAAAAARQVRVLEEVLADMVGEIPSDLDQLLAEANTFGLKLKEEES